MKFVPRNNCKHIKVETMKRIFLLLTMAMMLASCATSYKIQPEADLDSYTYVLLEDAAHYRTMRGDLEATLSGLGFRVVDPGQAEQLTDSDKVLTYTMQLFTRAKRADVRVRLVDSVTGNTVYAGEGSAAGEKSADQNAMLAAKEALEGIFNNYSGYSHVAKMDLSRSSAPAVQATPESTQESDKSAEAGEEPKPAKWENIKKTREQLVEYFDKNSRSLEPVEGIWTDSGNEYTVAIFKNKIASKRDFVAIVLSEKTDWKLCDVQMEIRMTAHPAAYTANYFLPDRTRVGGTLGLDKWGKLRGVFKDEDGDLELTFLRNYPEKFTAQVAEGNRRGPLSYGTGFFVDAAKGLVVTNYHVVDDPGSITITLSKHGLELDANLIMKDKRNDLAVLQVKDKAALKDRVSSLPYRLAKRSDIKVGQETVTIGFPLGSDLGRNHKVGTGVISALSGVNDEPGRMQISNPIQPGNSGGPVFNRRGEIVGVVVAGLSDKHYYEKRGFVPQNVNFAIKLQYLQGVVDLVADESLSRSESQTTATEEVQTLDSLVENVSPYVVQVKNYLQKRKEPAAVLMDPNTKTVNSSLETVQLF